MSIDTAAAAYVATIPGPREQTAPPATLALPVQESGEPAASGRWQAAVAMLAGLAAGAMIVAGVVLPW